MPKLKERAPHPASRPILIAPDEASRRKLLAETLRRAEGPVRAGGKAGVAHAAAELAAEAVLGAGGGLAGSGTSAAACPVEAEGLPPRLAETLRALLAGDSEKQVARRLGISPHTAHAHVRRLYRRFDVSSKGELLSRFVRV